nr:phosphotransferase [Actinopolymorpha cephalotaxi]
MQGGAWLLADPEGRPAILKLQEDKPGSRRPWTLLEAVNRMNAAGYPTPRWIAAGVTEAGIRYHVQEFVEGEPSSPLTADKVALLIEVIELHAGLDPDPGNDWNVYVGSVLGGERREDSRALLRGFGPPGNDVLAAFDRVLAECGPVRLPAGDLVHGDLNSCNVLLRDGRVSGVIDIDAFGSGTRVIDYAWLLREAYAMDAEPEAVRRVRRAGEAVAGPGVLAYCVAATSFDIVRFHVRHAPERLPGLLDRLQLMAADLSRPL